MSVVVDALSWLLILAGSACCVVGALGLIRLRGFYVRTHAASLVDSGGTGLLIAGLLLQAGWTLVAVKLLVIGLLIFFTSPTATHALANAARERGLDPAEHSEDASSKP